MAFVSEGHCAPLVAPCLSLSSSHAESFKKGGLKGQTVDQYR